MLTPHAYTKEAFRALHREQRRERLLTSGEFIRKRGPKLAKYFASGTEVDPASIHPRLQLIDSIGWESELFRLASLTWSVPVSNGYGRRMRFLVWDESNHKLIGILALGDPVFNLLVRDHVIGWNAGQRKRRLVNMMDAYVLGALPPYNMLLGGKLVASLIQTRQVKELFHRRYGDLRGIISKQRKHPSLVAVTTSSALGKSSVYDRLKLEREWVFEPIGFTSGWGHFHIPPDLFALMREYLSAKGHPYAANYGYGNGPNWRLRTTRVVLKLLCMNTDILRHGIFREVFLCRLAKNADSYLRGESPKPDYRGLRTVDEVSDLVQQRWILPRASRRDDFRKWNREHIWNLLDPSNLAAVTVEALTQTAGSKPAPLEAKALVSIAVNGPRGRGAKRGTGHVR